MCPLNCRWVYLTNKYLPSFYMVVQYGLHQSRIICYIWIIKTRGVNARSIASRGLYDILHEQVSTKYACRVGKLSPGAKRRILVSLKYYSDKENILRQSTHTNDIRDFKEKDTNVLEKLHMNYAKRTLNLSKYASNIAVQGDLARFPLLHNARGLAVKYWLRLCYGTSGVLLNAAFKITCDNDDPWLQSIRYLLTQNGFGDVFLDPAPVMPNFGKTFVQRLNDQFQQSWKSNMRASSRFMYLNQCKNGYERSTYLSVIKNHEVRNIFIRLRVDMNVLATCINTDSLRLLSAQCVSQGLKT